MISQSTRISCVTAIEALLRDNFKILYFYEHFMNPYDTTLQQWQTQEAAQIARWQAAGCTVGVATPAQIQGMSGLQVFEAMLAGSLPRAPIGQTLDFNLMEARLGEAVFQGQPYQPDGHDPWRLVLHLARFSLGLRGAHQLTCWQGLHDARAESESRACTHAQSAPRSRHRQSHPRRQSSRHRRSLTCGARRQAVCACDDHLYGV